MNTTATFRVFALLLFLTVGASAQTLTPPGITGVFVDIAHIHHDTDSNGDTWDYAWADDDNLYTFADDSRGYAHGKGDRNLNFNMLTGDAWDKLTGSSVNTMDEYGPSTQEVRQWRNLENDRLRLH